MISSKSQTIDGKVSVGRSLSVGGEATVQGGVTVNHDLMVRGRVICRDIQGNNKGLYSSPESLNAMYPKPLPGWYAYVETIKQNAQTIVIYVVEDGRWVPSHTESMLDYIDPHDYKESLAILEENLSGDIEDLDEALNDEITNRVAAIADETSAREDADTALTEALAAEVAARIEADANVTDSIDNAIAVETQAREDADGVLDGKISAEAQARLGDVLQLQTSITAEEEARRDDVDTINEALTELGKTVWPLQAELGVTPNLIEYTNEDHEVQVSREVRRNNHIVSDEDLTSLRVSKAYNGDSTDIDQELVSSKSFNSSVREYGTHLFSVHVSAFDMSMVVSREVIVELPMYFGFSSAANASALDIPSLQKQTLKTSPSGTYNITNDTDGKHLWLCIPSRMTISRVVSNGFDVPMLAVVNGTTPLGTYKCYRSASETGINQGTIKITIS